MSHFTTVKTQINDLDALEQAMEGCNYKVKRGKKVKVRGYQGATLDAVMCIDVGSQYDIGVLEEEDGTYKIVSDWWGIETTTGKTQNEVVEEINREYAFVRVVNACEAQGYHVEKERQEDGSIQVVASRWG